MHHEAELIQGGPGQGACITQRERHDCDQRAVRSAHLEDQVGKWLTTLVIPADWRADIERLQRREAQIERPAVDTARIERQLANLRDLFADADITREEYIGRKRALMASLNGGLPQPTYSEAVLVAPPGSSSGSGTSGSSGRDWPGTSICR